MNATLTFVTLPSSTAPAPNLAELVAADISAYVGGTQPLVGVFVDTSGPNLAVNISAVYPANSQITGASNAVVPASIEVSPLFFLCANVNRSETELFVTISALYPAHSHRANSCCLL